MVIVGEIVSSLDRIAVAAVYRQTKATQPRWDEFLRYKISLLDIVHDAERKQLSIEEAADWKVTTLLHCSHYILTDRL